MLVDDDNKIAGLSPAKQALLRLRRRNAVSSLLPRRDPDRPAPLSFAQQRLWLIHQLDPASHLYNVPRLVEIAGPLDPVRLQKALDRVIERHEALRTVFAVEGGEPVQIVLAQVAVPVQRQELGPGKPPGAVEQLAAAEYRKPFDLARGPLLRAHLWSVAGDRHVLLIVMHHIVSDGWTGGLLFEELGLAYEGRRNAPPLAVQYPDYAAWQRATLTAAALEPHLSYWLEHLAGAPALLDLPLDRERSQAATFAGRTESLALDDQLVRRLREFCLQNNVTLFTGLLAGLHMLLALWTGTRDMVLGTVASHRSRTELENLIGCYVNFLALRTPLAETDTPRSLLRATQATVSGAFAHQECPFEKVVEAVNPRRALNVNPLYNVALLLQNYPEMAFRADELEARFLPLDTEVAFLDLRFLASETAAGLRLDCEYNTALFDASTARELLASFASALRFLVDQPDRACTGMCLTEGLAQQALRSRAREKGSAATPGERPPQTLAIAATFTAEPLEPALAFWMRELHVPVRIAFAPYNQVFQQLLQPGSLLAANDAGLNVILLRPEDWGDPARYGENARQLAAALRNAAPRRHLLCLCPAFSSFAHGPAFESALADALGGMAHVTLIGSREILARYPVTAYEDEHSDRVAHIPYTPAFFTALATVIARRFHLLARAPYKAIAVDCDGTLWTGVCGEDGPAGVVVDAGRSALQQFLIEQHRAGMLLCLCSKNVQEDVDAVFRAHPGMLLRPGHIAAARINWQPKSQNLEELARELNLGLDSFLFLDDNAVECAEVRAHHPQVLTLELPAETGRIASFLDSVWAFDRRQATGEDLDRTRLYQENRDRDALRSSAASFDAFLAQLELEIEIRPARAEELARVAQLSERTNQFNFTTIRRTEAQIAALRADGFGVLAVHVADRFGAYGLVGVVIYRVSGQVLTVDTFLLSCRALGRRVEHAMLAHVGALARASGAETVAVTCTPTAKNQPARDFLAQVGSSYQGPGNEFHFPAAALSSRELIEASAARPAAAAAASPAPAPAVPPHIETLRRIAAEWNTVERIERAVAHSQRLRQASSGFEAPATPFEETMAALWAALLPVERAGRRDDFFSLGGHSLLAAQLVARLRHSLGVEMPLRAVFEHPVLSDLAAQAEALRRGHSPPVLLAPAPALRGGPLPLSFAQQRLWFLDQLEPGNPFYNVPQAFRLRGPFDPAAFERSVHAVAARHESLRTTFTQQEGQPVQVIAPQVAIPIETMPQEDAAGAPGWEQLVQEEISRPFDLARGPLLRVRILPLGSEDHVVVLTMHHIISDRWSMGRLAEELAAHYSAYRAGTEPLVPALPLQYADYALWQRRVLAGETLAQQAAYWKRQLAGAPALLELPTDRPRPAVETHHGALATRLLPADLVSRLAALGRAEGATLFMTLLAAFQALLARYARAEDVVVGSPIAGRNHADFEPLIGFFVNTLALRADCSGDPAFRVLLGRVRATALDAYVHQDIPFEKLVEELEPERSLSYNPVFQVLFALQNAPLIPLRLEGLTLARLPLHTGTSTFDLSCFAVEVPEGLLLRAEYNTALWNQPTIERLLEHYERLLAAVAAEPGTPLSQIPLLTGAEREHIVQVFNDTVLDPPPGCLIHDFLTRQARLTPQAAALIAGTERISYRELNSRANRLAHYLQARGAGPDVLIGVFCRRTVDLVVALFGILKSGSAYVPLDPKYPLDRRAAIVQDAGIRLLVTEDAFTAEAEALSLHRTVERISLDGDRGAIAGAPDTEPASGAQPGNLAYVLFTSGSTGRPKGVALEHRNAVTFIRWAVAEFGVERLRGVLFGTSIGFDMSTFELFVTTAAGGSIILAGNVLELSALAAREEVTLINTVPSAIAELVAAGAVPPSVETVALAGEALPDALAEAIYRDTRVKAVYNLYGPTETGYSTGERVARGAPVTIGRPLSDVFAYVLEPGGALAPVGVAGELYLGGGGVARGYYGQPALTAERFVPDPFRAERGARMYRTGDLCRWLPGGRLAYLGRLDHQVKLRGFRVELGEIEATLNRHPAVRQSFVVAAATPAQGTRLAAYVVLDPRASVSAEELCRHAASSLPDFMVPAACLILPAFPLTANGKVNRAALPPPDFRSPDHEPFAAPSTAAEEAVARIWSRVLGRERISRTGHFFRLGGHSLLATQVISRVREALGVEVPLRTVFEAPVLADFAALLEGRTRALPALPPLAPAPRHLPLPLSFAQQRLWFLDQLEPGSAQYNIPCTLRAGFALRPALVERSLNAVIARHEALRTRFVAEDGQPRQEIAASLHITVPYTDLRPLAADERQAEARRLAEQEARRPFELARGPLLRAQVIQLAEEDFLLVLQVHHIVSDRWSMNVLLREFSEAYQSLAGNQPLALAPLPVQYADYAVWQRLLLAGPSYQDQLAYWKEQLAAAPAVLDLPTDRPRPAIETSNGAVAGALWGGGLIEKVASLAEREGATPFMVLLAVFELLLARYSGQDDLLVGTAVASRTHPAVEPLIGFFTNTLPLRARIDEQRSFTALLAQVRETALGAFAHQDLPFEKLVEELEPERSLSRSPLVQVFFVVQNAPAEGALFGGLPFAHIETDTRTAKGDLFLSLAEAGGAWKVRLEFNTDLFDRSTAERLLDHFRTLLAAVLASPSEPLLHLSMLAPAERELIVDTWNATGAAYPREARFTELFAAQARRTPERRAAVCGADALTYAELESESNRLARYLARRGVGAGDLVGIYLERSLTMITALLAVQKAGAAYVPIDPSFPAERIRLMLEGAALRSVVTEAALAAKRPAPEVPAICLDVESGSIAAESDGPCPGAGTSESIAYVIFTSGSTGKPKGVAVTARNLVNLLVSMRREPGFRDDDVLVAVTTLSFDIAGLELYLPLLSGGTVVLATREDAGDGRRLLALLESSAATVLQATPATWRMLLAAGWRGPARPEVKARFKALCGGEALPPDLAAALEPLCGELWNLYGPTETTIWSSVDRVRAGGITIGRPIANTRFYILDRYRNPVPAGVPGELYIGGEGVAAGYLHRPELTAERFLPDPFSPSPEARLYRTGDRARFLPDGRVECLGRLDGQVKLRGYRIELGDVESTLNAAEGVRQSAALVREDGGDRKLVAYLLPAAGATLPEEALRRHCRERLPEYMVPSAFVVLSAWPLTPNGKLDRKALPAPLRPPAAAAGDGGWATPAEEVVAAIWSAVLQTDVLSPADDFFALGGHSLLGTQVISRLREAFGVELPLRALFEAPTVAGLAQRMAAAAGGGAPRRAPLERARRSGPLPLSYAQQRLWFLDQLEPGNPLFNIPYLVRLRGPLDRGALAASLAEIAQRHETLRTRFETVDDQPVQIVDSAGQLPLRVMDLEPLPASERVAAARRLALEEVARPFVLAAAAPVRAALLRLADDDHALIVTMHHIVSDRWSMGVLSEEVAALYEAFLEGRPSPLPPLPVQYADYALWQRRYLDEGVLAAQLAYWKEQLAGAPPLLELPVDRARALDAGSPGGVLHRPLPPELARELRRLSRGEGATLFMTLLAAFNIVLARWSGQNDLVVGTDLANRTELLTERLIGFFVNLLPVRTRLSGTQSFREILQGVREASLGAFAHQDIPFEKLVEELAPVRVPGRNPLVEVLFVFQNTPHRTQPFGGLTPGPLGVSSRSRFDLVLFVNDPDGAPVATWMYHPGLFPEPVIARVAAQFETVLAAVAADPGITFNALGRVLAEQAAQQRAEEQQNFAGASARRLHSLRRRSAPEPETSRVGTGQRASGSEGDL